jgi:hypothetical protein
MPRVWHVRAPLRNGVIAGAGKGPRPVLVPAALLLYAAGLIPPFGGRSIVLDRLFLASGFHSGGSRATPGCSSSNYSVTRAGALRPMPQPCGNEKALG